jgi:hypothetical protein
MTNEIMNGKRKKKDRGEQTTIFQSPQCNSLLPFGMQPGVGVLAASKIK